MLSKEYEKKHGISHSYEESMAFAQEFKDQLTEGQFEEMSWLINSNAAEGSFPSRDGLALLAKLMRGLISRDEYVAESFKFCKEMEAELHRSSQA